MNFRLFFVTDFVEHLPEHLVVYQPGVLDCYKRIMILFITNSLLSYYTEIKEKIPILRVSCHCLHSYLSSTGKVTGCSR